MSCVAGVPWRLCGADGGLEGGSTWAGGPAGVSLAKAAPSGRAVRSGPAAGGGSRSMGPAGMKAGAGAVGSAYARGGDAEPRRSVRATGVSLAAWRVAGPAEGAGSGAEAASASSVVGCSCETEVKRWPSRGRAFRGRGNPCVGEGAGVFSV